MHSSITTTPPFPDAAPGEPENGLLLLDSGARIILANRSFCRLISVPDDRNLAGADGIALVRTHLAPLITDTEAAARLLASLQARAALPWFKCRIAAAGGAREVGCSVRAPGDGAVLLLIDDIAKGEKGHGIEEEQKRYRELFDLAPDGYFVCDPSGLILDVNRAGTLLLGRGKESLIGTFCQSHILPECGEAYRDLATRLESGVSEPPLGVEVWVQPATGEPVPVSLSAAAVRNNQGNFAEIRWLARDVSHRKRADAERERLLAENQSLAAVLAEERDLLRTVMEHTNIHLAYLDAEFRFVRVNTAYAEGSGYTKEELIGRKHFDLFPNSENQAIFERVRDTGEEFRIYAKPFVYKNQPERGTTYWDWSLIPVKDAKGDVLGLVFSLADVTERVRAAEEVRVQNKRLGVLNAVITASASAFSLDELLDDTLEAVLDHLKFDLGGIYTLERGARTQAVLRSHRNIPEFSVMQNRTLNVYHRPYNQVFIAGQPWFVEGAEGADARTLDTLADFGVSSLAFIPLIVESSVVGALVLGSTAGREIPPGARRLLEAISRELGAGVLRGMLYDRLEATNREANLYLDILTHDIRNADNVANIYAGLLLDTLEGEPRTYADRLKGSIKKSISILANVATIRKIHELHTELRPISLHAVIREEIGHFPEVSINYDGFSEEVLADDLLPEVFANLIGNAAKHGGPEIEVAITVEDAEEEGMVLVTVADTGPGVPDDAKKTFFSRFEQEKVQGRGQGLGLSICRMLAARYGGRIWVDDRVAGRPEEGAAFRFTLRKADGG
ncbi:PAS domain S-box protein [Methanoculleus sp. 7T]|uniref:PAS domain S-box protein n=1 Tax=Methanoculleus sp. 7T TaxID=2937282 RepID=UPI0020BF06A4|nr:PAS domain S-box protein [Methanoculleus sp. 7T]MCK8519008.1 PAS domain S-box protein [Methanoculleus sp. 7T]